jgi:hypothetical protein
MSGLNPSPTAPDAPAITPLAATTAVVRPTPADDPSMHTRDTLHPQWYVRGIIYLVAFLHVQFHVTFRACALLLSCINFIFTNLPGNLLSTRMPLTLETVFAKMQFIL